jgi:hypothetical protein
VHANEAGAGVITSRFAGGNFAVGLRIGDTRFDFVQDLLFGKAGVFQARDLGHAEGGKPLQSALQNNLDEVVRQTDEPESDCVSTDGVQLIRASDVKDLRLGVASPCEIRCRVTARERMLPLVRRGDQGHASVVAQASLLDLNQLRDFGVRGIQFFELLEAAGPHAGLVERAIIRQDMFLAAGRQEDEHTEKQSARLHISILASGKQNAVACAVGDTGAKDRYSVGFRKRGRLTLHESGNE